MEADSPLAKVRLLIAGGMREVAEALLREFLNLTLQVDASHAELRTDGYSLNSLHGILTLRTPYQGHDRLFFKYHQEEDESKGVAEYYNSKLLEEAGFPVDVPLAARQVPGEQILLYSVRTDVRLADACRAVEHGRTEGGWSEADLVRLQAELDRDLGARYVKSLRLAPRAEAAGEALHQLFYHRLVDAEATPNGEPGGRWKTFYTEQEFRFPGVLEPMNWAELSTLRWRINGREYQHTLAELFAAAQRVLNPENLLDPCPVVLAHGDAHNANVWVERGTPDRLVLFDPAFAGRNLPAFLAEVKPTFHNIFAHGDWLYHADDAASQYTVYATRQEGWLNVQHDWALTPLRAAFLQSKEEHVWRPLLQALQQLSPEALGDWENYLRLALFCCPTLVMNLTPGAARHNGISGLLGLAIAVMCGSPCASADDEVSGFLRRVASGGKTG